MDPMSVLMLILSPGHGDLVQPSAACCSGEFGDLPSAAAGCHSGHTGIDQSMESRDGAGVGLLPTNLPFCTGSLWPSRGLLPTGEWLSEVLSGSCLLPDCGHHHELGPCPRWTMPLSYADSLRLFLAYHEECKLLSSLLVSHMAAANLCRSTSVALPFFHNELQLCGLLGFLFPLPCLPFSRPLLTLFSTYIFFRLLYFFVVVDF